MAGDRDTIAAVATPPGAGAIGVIRVSGPGAHGVVRALAPGLPHPLPERRALVARLQWSGALLDESLVLAFHGPRSFTGEDVVEFQCHGGPATMRRVLAAVLEAGARPAEPGEFTRRALLAGRLDLVQAEAIATLVQAESDAAQATALQHLEGALSRELGALREALTELVVLVEAAIDFSLEEHVYSISGAEILERLGPVEGRVAALLATWQDGRLRHEGVRVALAGLPNAGKSSLLNRLLGEERALVTELPGTTRDWIEEGVVLDGVAYRLVDTAGLRATEDQVEALGIARARERVAASDVVLVVVDGSDPGPWWSEVAPLVAGRPWAVLWNKQDLSAAQQEPTEAHEAEVVLGLSLATGAGVERLPEVLKQLAERAGLGSGGEGALITRSRHRAALVELSEALARAAGAAEEGLEPEFVALDLRLGLDALGGLTGAVTSDDILNRIFGDFCVGK